MSLTCYLNIICIGTLYLPLNFDIPGQATTPWAWALWAENQGWKGSPGDTTATRGKSTEIGKGIEIGWEIPPTPNNMNVLLIFCVCDVNTYIFLGSYRTAGGLGRKPKRDFGGPPGDNSEDDESTGWGSAVYSRCCPAHQGGQISLPFSVSLRCFKKMLQFSGDNSKNRGEKGIIVQEAWYQTVYLYSVHLSVRWPNWFSHRWQALWLPPLLLMIPPCWMSRQARFQSSRRKSIVTGNFTQLHAVFLCECILTPCVCSQCIKTKHFVL